jgi:taurine--2-oxoglutarate transaminase
MTERLIESTGLDQVAGIITEISHGVGTTHPPDEYNPQIREMTKRLGILWIVDEVLTGFGRMGTWFAYQKYGVTPDIMTVAKGISSSALPASAVIYSQEVADRLEGYRWYHVNTFAGHPVTMAAVCANLEYLIENKGPEQSQKAGEYFGSKLLELEQKHKSVGKVAGAGMLWQVEIVKNKQTGEVFIPADRNSDFTGNIDAEYPIYIVKNKGFEKGVLIGGACPNTLRLGASLFVTKADMDKAIDALDYALNYIDEMAD